MEPDVDALVEGVNTAVEVEVQFHDCDPMGIVWHGHYVKYLEVARCKLLELFDYSYNDMFDSGYAWPVIDMQLRYVKPARFEQTIRVAVQLLEWRFRLKLAYRITDAASGEKLVTGTTTQVATNFTTGEMSIGSPALVEEKLRAWQTKRT